MMSCVLYKGQNPTAYMLEVFQVSYHEAIALSLFAYRGSHLSDEMLLLTARHQMRIEGHELSFVRAATKNRRISR
jgi:hypothetical protein